MIAPPEVMFANAMASAGFQPPANIVADGSIHRFKAPNDKRGATSAWYVLYGDHPASGVFGDWRDGGEPHKWFAISLGKVTPEEQLEHTRHIAQAKALRDVTLAATRKKAAVRAQNVWHAAHEADEGHPYFLAKKVTPHGIRQKGNALLVPVCDVAGAIHGLQRISPTGNKRFAVGSHVSGHFFAFGDLAVAETILISEGFATSATVHEATGYAAIVAFDCGNLEPVARIVHREYPAARIILCADNDRKTPGNPGLTKARAAAEIVSGVVFFPDFADIESGSDWNDYAALHGLEAVAREFDQKLIKSAAADNHVVLVLENAPRRYAEQFLRRRYSQGDIPTLRRWRGQWYHWTGTHYTDLSDEALTAETCAFLDLCSYDNMGTIKRAKHTRTATADVSKAIMSLPKVLVNGESAPKWIDGVKPPTDAPLLPCSNGLLDMGARKLYRSTPSYFETYAVPYHFEPNAPKPVAWLKFLAELWPEDSQCVSLLQEWFGYVLSGETSHHKIMLVVGPKRSGKGTIARVLTRLIGDGNVANPTLGSIGERFGLQPLLDKPVGIIGDARLSGRNDLPSVSERLLSITGEDQQTVDRKNLTAVTGKLPTRFMVLTNELPRLTDASGALASRFLILPMTRSFYGNEDRNLITRLLKELPSILNWALEGWEDLQKRGCFTKPDAANEHVERLEDLGSPIAEFVRERCELKPCVLVPIQSIFNAWREWCVDAGIEHPGTRQTFGRNLKAACPETETCLMRISGKRVNHYKHIRLT